jgi:tetratricopeptide (TPR) repeat protein
LPGDDIAVVEFRTAGLADKHGRDIRVVTASGKAVPWRLLQTGPGDFIRLAFAVRSGSRYYIYFGNTDPPPDKAEPLTIRRGVLLEVWAYRGGLADNIAQARKTLTRAMKHKPIGREFRDRIFLGYNPFGPQTTIVQQYTAYFLTPAAGEYKFVLSTNNASFLLVNDRLIISDGRWHRPRRYPNHTGSIALNKGLNKLTLLHINPWGWPMAMVAWQRSGKKLIAPIPPGAYSEVITAQAGAIERYGESGGFDFAIEPAGESFVQNSYLQRRIFRIKTTGRGFGKDTRWLWNFGDGQELTSSKRTVEHVYLRPGTYNISLNAMKKWARPNQARTHRVKVERIWDSIARNKLDSPKSHAKIVAGYNFATLGASANVEAAKLLRLAGDFDALNLACQAFVARQSASDKQIRTLMKIYIQALLAARQVNQAVAALQRAARISKDPDTRAAMLLRAGELQLEPLNQPTTAMKTFDNILAETTGQIKQSTLRRIYAGQGDVWLAQGKTEQARKAYRQAGLGSDHARKYPAIVRGDFARRAEEYLRDKNYRAAQDALDEWELTFPADKLAGYSTLLRCRLLLGQRKYSAAARLAERLAGANPQGNYTATLQKLAKEARSKSDR